MRGWLGFEILDRSTGARRRLILGDREEAYRRGITIGGFSDCSVRLEGPSAEGVRARFEGASNHRFLIVESAPASSPLSATLGNRKRVDYLPFEIGDFSLRFLEIGIDATIAGLSRRGESFEAALASLEVFGADGREACPRLLANLRAWDKMVRSRSRDTLRKLGVEVGWPTRKRILSWVLQFATDPDPEVRYQALPVLAELRAMEALRQRLSDSEPKVRARAAMWLWNLKRRPEGLVEVLVQDLREAVNKESDDLAIYPLLVLKMMGPAARSAIPVIALAMEKNILFARGTMAAIERKG
jgi:hypothetical protein